MGKDDRELCCDVAQAPALALLLDLDGTLVPFADTPAEAALDDEGAELLRSLIALGVGVVVVSGRLRADVERVQARVPGAWWVAEHGGWRHAGNGWAHVGAAHPELDGVGARLEQLAGGTIGARVERKSASVCLHWRRVPADDRAELVDAAEQLIDEWLDAHPGHERLSGIDMVEVRAEDQHKGTAVQWVRSHDARTRIIAIGDDVTDEDMFRALEPGDLAVVVGQPGDRISSAQVAVPDVTGVRRFLAWIAAARRDGAASAAPPVSRVETLERPPRCGLLVLSNRTPSLDALSRRREVGGLVSALEPALESDKGVWLGWSGQEREGTIALRVDRSAIPVRACFDLSPRQRRLFYRGFCNRSLWPMLHGLPGRVRYEDDEWAEYVAVNEIYARLAGELVVPHGTIWVHDYQLLLVPSFLRQRGHTGPIGLFLHVPFPSRDLIRTAPWAPQLVEGMLACDLVGFHTAGFVRNFVEAAWDTLRASWDGRRLSYGTEQTSVAAFPIAIDADAIRADAEASLMPEVEGLRAMLGDRKLLLGVDRLDYSKGIPERLEAFERLLERMPQWRGRVSVVQISVPSRADVPEYAELRARVEQLVGRINGHFGEADWVPVRYLYRSYGRAVLAQLYRLADVAIVTPLSDGMNLVAKEYVAAQDSMRPGVLVLSRFAGASDELRSALLTNPYHRDGLAADLDHALSMPLEERRERHQRLRQVVEDTTPVDWAHRYLEALAAARGT